MCNASSWTQTTSVITRMSVWICSWFTSVLSYLQQELLLRHTKKWYHLRITYWVWKLWFMHSLSTLVSSTTILSTPVLSTVVSSVQCQFVVVNHTLIKFNVQFNVLWNKPCPILWNASKKSKNFDIGICKSYNDSECSLKEYSQNFNKGMQTFVNQQCSK